MKKIRWLIAFAVLLYLGVQNLNIVISTAKVFLGFLFPFIIGFGIAFILNVPMKFIEHHLFGKVLKQKKKAAQKLSRPVSLVLAICFVLCVFVIVMLVVVPELGATFVSVGKKIEENIPVFQKWIDNAFGNNPEIPSPLFPDSLRLWKRNWKRLFSNVVVITLPSRTRAWRLKETPRNFSIRCRVAVVCLKEK